VEINIHITEFPTEKLSILDKELMAKAIDAAGNAYAPYSSFNVGAALRLANGSIVTGNNQENAAYPSGLCAERVALFYAGAQHPGVPISDLAIVALVNGQIKENISPCGGCRQVMLETEQRSKYPLRVLLIGEHTTRIISSAKNLLPLAFTEEDLENKK